MKKLSLFCIAAAFAVFLSGCAGNDANKISSVEEYSESAAVETTTSTPEPTPSSAPKHVSIIKMESIENENLATYELIELDDDIASGICCGVGNYATLVEDGEPGGGYAVYDLNGEYDTLSFSASHIPYCDELDCTYSFYFDGELAHMFYIKADQPPSKHEISVKGVKELKIVGDDYAGRSILYDMWFERAEPTAEKE